MSAIEREQQRQQALLHSLRVRDQGTSLQTWTGRSDARLLRGWQAYDANAGASAERALAASFPTVALLVGEESFAALARAFWYAHPPQHGDLALFGAGLAAFLETSDQLADVPYVADCARLDWQLACAERAADDEVDRASLQRLEDSDPSRLRIELMPGTAVLVSTYPVVSLWQAHRPAAGDDHPFAAVRDALAAGRAENALVWRSGWRARLVAIDDATARWTRCLLAGADLASALREAGDGFAFEPWLIEALQQGWLARVRPIDLSLAQKDSPCLP